MVADNWKLSLERFFYDRADAIEGKPTLLEHCIVSAKEPRLAAQPEFHADLIDSLVSQASIDQDADVLEVGCASGYIACGMASRVRHYTGIDLAAMPIEIANKMELPNATFKQGDGGELPFSAGSFDAVFACDVFSNFPSFDDIKPLLMEMVRVARKGGRVMAASITDAEQSEAFQRHVYEISARLDKEFGAPPIPPTRRHNPFRNLIRTVRGLPTPPSGQASITNYNFFKRDFEIFAEENDLSIKIRDVHGLSPYRGYRFNVIFTKMNP